LQWDQPFYTTSGVTTDLDIYLVNHATGQVVADAASDNIANQTPLELLSFQNNTAVTGTTQFDVVISKFAGPDVGRLKYVNFGANSSGPITFNEYATHSPTITPHSASADAMSVVAAPFYGQRTPEGFDSRGPATILFTPAGTPLGSPQVRAKPDITATDGVDTSFFGSDIDGNGFPNFFGTSAAAPHAAAVAALVAQAHPGYTPSQIYSALKSTADPNIGGTPGNPNLVGAGLIDAYRAVIGLPTASTLNTSDNFESGTESRNWEIYNSGAGRTQVTKSNGPASGSYQLTMDGSLAGFSPSVLSEAILHINAAGRQDVTLTFDQKEFNDPDDAMPATFSGHGNYDGVALSVDGVNWYRIVSLTGSDSTNTYQTRTFDISRIAAAAGLTLTADTRIKFQHYNVNSYMIPNQGFAFDNIKFTALSALTGTTIDDGTVQRSRIRSFTFDFAGNVISFSVIPPAFLLRRSDGLTIPLVLGSGTTVGGGHSHLVLVPTGPDLQGGSLPDGKYTLTIDGRLISDDAGNAIDAAGNGVAGSTTTLSFFRFFGDANGDGVVDATDYLAFRNAYRSGDATSAANSIFDYNGNGVFEALDLQAFTTNFRKRRLS
jgi:hypothetical protein